MADAKSDTTNKPIFDPQVDALVRASGHTVNDALLILTELNRIGWTVRPITGFLATLKDQTP